MPKAINNPISNLKRKSNSKAKLPQVKAKPQILHNYRSNHSSKLSRKTSDDLPSKTIYYKALDYKNVPKYLQAYLEVSHKRNNLKPDKLAALENFAGNFSEKVRDKKSDQKEIESNSNTEDS